MSEWAPFVSFVLSLPASYFVAAVTVRMALRRYQSEKWFERRLDAYTQVIEALHKMKRCTGHRMEAEMKDEPIAGESEKLLLAEYASGLRELERLTDIGALVFSTDMVGLLDKLLVDLNKAYDEPTLFHYLNEQTGALSESLKSVRLIAIRDLNAPKFF